MKPLPPTPELMALASRIIWFEPPETALGDPVRFLAYAMTYATSDEIVLLRRHVGDEGFAEAVRRAPPGIFDPRSWAYWNIMADRYPVPPMPTRSIPG